MAIVTPRWEDGTYWPKWFKTCDAIFWGVLEVPGVPPWMVWIREVSDPVLELICTFPRQDNILDIILIVKLIKWGLIKYVCGIQKPSILIPF